jgi:TonB family protein
MEIRTGLLLLAVATAAGAADAQRPSAPPEALPYPYIAYTPDTADYYPGTAQALGEKGTASLAVCYGPDGRLGEVSLLESSGFPRIDQGAVMWARRVRVSPAVTNGAPQPGCVRLAAAFDPEKAGFSQGTPSGSPPAPAVIWQSP